MQSCSNSQPTQPKKDTLPAQPESLSIIMINGKTTVIRGKDTTFSSSDSNGSNVVIMGRGNKVIIK